MVGGRRPEIAGSAVATGRGDDGTTGLLYGGRIAKDDPRTDAYGTVDEAVAALGVARAALDAAGQADLASLVLDRQRELFVVGAELAVRPGAEDRLVDGVSRVSEEMLVRLEADLTRLEAGIEMPREFVVPGETAASAALELARAVLRRAERRVVGLRREGLTEGRAEGDWVVPYLNRLADLLWVLARCAEGAEARAPTPARVARSRGHQEA